MSKDWYLISTPNYFSGFEKDEFAQYAITGFQELLENSPEAWDVLVDGEKARVILQSTSKDDILNILAEIGRIRRGSLIYFNDEYWLTVTKPFNNKMNEQANIKHCYSSLRWLNEYGQIKETWFTLKTDPATNFGISDGKIIELGNERRSIIIQFNEDTRKIVKGQRFIFDDRAWKVTAKDGLDNGLIILTLEETEFNDRDNKELRIADYVEPNYSIFILNGNFIEISLDETVQIQVQVKNGDKILDNPSVIYSVSDETIATIDENGLLSPASLGQVEVIVQFENVSVKATVNVVEVPQDNKTVEIIGLDTILTLQSKSYKCEFSDNGLPYEDMGIFYLTADDGISPTSLATIQSQGNNTCTIKAGNKSGKVMLHVKNSDETVVGSKLIEVMSLI